MVLVSDKFDIQRTVRRDIFL